MEEWHGGEVARAVWQAENVTATPSRRKVSLTYIARRRHYAAVGRRCARVNERVETKLAVFNAERRCVHNGEKTNQRGNARKV